MLFFPAASLYAAVILPWSVLAMTRVVAGPASLATPFGHAHELLLGYALAVVAGHQMAPMSRSRASVLFGLWVAARLTFVTLPGRVALTLDMLFAVALATQVTPRLYRAAKKLRNQALPAMLTALCVGAAAYDTALFIGGAATLRALLGGIVLLLAALMLFMGGRIIAPAAAGQLYRQGDSLVARVQPKIEGLLLASMAAAVAFIVLPGYELVPRVACAAAGVFALVRLLRWRLWACNGRRDLLCLGTGYAWLAFGLLAIAGSAPGNLRTAALHVITIGALGTLTANVMANTVLLKARRQPAMEWIPSLVTVLIGAATLSRVAAALADAHAVDLLMLAAACWSLAFGAVFWLVQQCVLASVRHTDAPRL